MKAAIELFIARGLEGMSIEQIARDAGVTRATVYRRWKRKEDLLVHALGEVRAREEQVEDWGEVDADRFVALMTEVTTSALGRADLARLVARLLGESPSHPDLLKAYWEAHLAPRREAFSRSLRAMQASGRLASTADPEILQDMISGALMYRFLVQPGPHSVQARTDYIARLLESIGLREEAKSKRGT